MLFTLRMTIVPKPGIQQLPPHCMWMAPLHPASFLGTPHPDPTGFSSQFKPFVSPSSAQAVLFLCSERSSPSSPDAPDTILSWGEPVLSLYHTARAGRLPRVCVMITVWCCSNLRSSRSAAADPSRQSAIHSPSVHDQRRKTRTLKFL